MRILISGGEGVLAMALKSALRERNLDFIALSHQDWDITDLTQSERILTAINPTVLINTAAFTSVDEAEIKRDKARAVNTLAPGQLALLARTRGIKFIHLSTNYVFDGERAILYAENMGTHPLNHYGVTKLRGEKAVLCRNREALIIRTSTLFDPHGENFIRRIWRALERGGSLKINAHSYTQPTPAEELAAFIVNLLETQPETRGLLHYTGLRALSWYEWALMVGAGYQEFHPQARIHLTPVTDYPTRAVRPRHALLDNRRRQSLLPEPAPLSLETWVRRALEVWENRSLN